jgi:hypothetical protein
MHERVYEHRELLPLRMLQKVIEKLEYAEVMMILKAHEKAV